MNGSIGETELAPGANGWLGSIAGVAEDGRFIESERFESESTAKRNSDRPEQSEWWEETAKLISEPYFRDCNEVDEYKGSGSNDAGIVQVYPGTKMPTVMRARILIAGLLVVT